MNIASRSNMCSTIVIGNFIAYYHNDVERTLKSMVRNLKQQIEQANFPTFAETIYDDEGRLHQRHWLDGYKVDKFAFFVTTVYADRGYPDKVVEALRELGFVVDTKIKQYNAKNETKIYMVYGPVNRVLKKLALYDSHGVPLPVVEKPKRASKKKIIETEAVAA